MEQNNLKTYVVNLFGTNYTFTTTENKFKKIAEKINLELTKALLIERVVPNILLCEQTKEIKNTNLNGEIRVR